LFGRTLRSELFGQLRHCLEQVGDQADIGNLEDRRVLVLVDRDDGLGILHPREVLDRARRAGLPIIHTNIRYQPERFLDGGVWLKKAPVMKAMVEGNPHAAFCPEVAPRPEELVISKQYPSSFFGTSLAPTLRALGVDTVVLMGCSTSGCIRATAVDGLQHGFRVMVIRECVGDRHPDPHEANLFDIDSKYGDVIAKEELLAHIDA